MPAGEHCKFSLLLLCFTTQSQNSACVFTSSLNSCCPSFSTTVLQLFLYPSCIDFRASSSCSAMSDYFKVTVNSGLLIPPHCLRGITWTSHYSSLTSSISLYFHFLLIGLVAGALRLNYISASRRQCRICRLAPPLQSPCVVGTSKKFYPHIMVTRSLSYMVTHCVSNRVTGTVTPHAAP